MAEGKINIVITEDILKNQILPEGELEGPDYCISAIFEWAVPHWDWVEGSIGIGAVKVSRKLAEKFIGRIDELFPKRKMDTGMLWVNYGPSARERLQEWEIEIDFSKINYKKEC